MSGCMAEELIDMIEVPMVASAAMLRRLVGLVFFCLFLFSPRLESRGLAAEHSLKLFPEEAITEVRLSNGMVFLLMNHGATPVFSAYIRVRVGGMDEPKGLSGLAHVIEHMAFKGTKRLGTRNWEAERKLLEQIEVVGQKLATEYRRAAGPRLDVVGKLKEELAALSGQHRQYVEPEAISRELQRRGGLHFNATTSQDLTTYFVSLPTSELEFWAELESERIFAPVFREFYRERDVVLEERRSRIVDDPFGLLYTDFLRAAFPGSPYGIPTIGEEQDLLTLTRTQAEEFLRTHYRPDKTVGAIVGQFSTPRLKRLLERSFGRITGPPLRAMNRQEPAVDPPPYQRSSCRVDLARPAQPRLLMGYHKPTLPHRDDYIFDVVATLLASDRSSRLYRSLVMEKGLAVSVDAYAGSPGSRLPNLFMVIAVPQPGVPLDRLAEEVTTALTELQVTLVSEEELRQAKKKLIDHQIWGLEQNARIASELSYFQAIAGDWRYLVRYPDAVTSITAQEVQQAAQKYFVAGNRCLGFLQ